MSTSAARYMKLVSSHSRPRGRKRLARFGVHTIAGLAAGLALSLGLGLPSVAGAQDGQEVENAPDPQGVQEAPTVLAQFTTAIENREPIDQVSFVENDVRKVYFFSDLRGLGGQTVLHRWIYDGKTMAEVRFEVAGPRWRVWSSKELLEDWIGDWTVEIVTGDGEVLAAETFTYKAPDA